MQVKRDRSQAHSPRMIAIKKEFKKGRVLDSRDLIQMGIKDTDGAIKNTIYDLINYYDLDLLRVSRGRELIGWIVASEIL